MLTQEMKVQRVLASLSMRKAGDVLGITGEAYRQRELGNTPITGAELALLARAYGKPVREAFPSYRPSEGEEALSAELAA